MNDGEITAVARVRVFVRHSVPHLKETTGWLRLSAMQSQGLHKVPVSSRVWYSGAGMAAKRCATVIIDCRLNTRVRLAFVDVLRAITTCEVLDTRQRPFVDGTTRNNWCRQVVIERFVVE